MPAAHRLTDNCTGHDGCPEKPLVTGSPDVYINNLKAGRETDKYESHGCVIHSPHQDHVEKGSPNVYVNKLPLARKDDPVDIDGTCKEGSPNVFANENS